MSVRMVQEGYQKTLTLAILGLEESVFVKINLILYHSKTKIIIGWGRLGTTLSKSNTYHVIIRVQH